MDDLTQIAGIGPVRAADLVAHNINTFQALATANADFLVKTMGVTPTMINGWKRAAAEKWADQIEAEADAPLAPVGSLPDSTDSKETAVYEHFLTGRAKR